jgi:protein tyrosine/serine phosphatase
MKLVSVSRLAAIVGVCTAALAVAFAAAPKPDLPNFHTVDPGIYRGGAPSDAGLAKLKAMGIVTIIDLRIAPHTVAKERATATRMGFTWINLPMGSAAPTSKQVATLMATLQQAPARPVFVHCQHGADRSGCMIGIWRVTHDHWTYAQAFQEMRRYGFMIRWHDLSNAVRQRAAS